MTVTITELILVCCHGIWLGGPSLGMNEEEWLIAPFQRGETPTFVEHLKAGLNCLIASPNAVLIFSGGPTRHESRFSEAESYMRLAQAHEFWGLVSNQSAQERIVLEKRALDSFQNLLYSVTKFYEVTRSWPKHVTIISNEFKRARFLDLHRQAIGWSSDALTYIGIDPEYMRHDAKRAASVRQGEKQNGHDAWKEDPLGMGPVLTAKRSGRNPWHVKQTLFESEALTERSGVRWVTIKDTEFLTTEQQPWHSTS